MRNLAQINIPVILTLLASTPRHVYGDIRTVVNILRTFNYILSIVTDFHDLFLSSFSFNQSLGLNN